MTGEHVTVRIYGESYPLRTESPAARIEDLARLVDLRMREVAASGKVVVTSKIAVLAALHIADELFRLREERAQPAVAPGPPPGPSPPAAATIPAEDEARLRRLVDRLDAVLAP